jgi:CBS-domain-containing membrane protein
MSDLKRKDPVVSHEDDEPPKKHIKPAIVKGELDGLILFLARLTVNNLTPRTPPSAKTTYWRGIVTAHRDDSLSSVLVKCCENNILSVPVLKKDNKYFGFVDMLDMVYAISNIFPEKPKELHDPQLLFETHESFKTITIRDILNYPYAKRNPYHPLFSGYSLFHAAEILAREGIHRVPIINHTKKITNIITQSMIFDLIADQAHLIDQAALNITVQELIDTRTITSHVIPIHSKTETIEAFKKMAENFVTALPVIDEDGSLVNVISIRDLRAIGGGSLLSRLWQSVETYKEMAQEDFPSMPQKLIVVIPSDTVGNVLNTLRRHAVHRVVVVNNKTDRRPISVISQGDLLRFLFFRITRLNSVIVENEE